MNAHIYGLTRCVATCTKCSISTSRAPKCCVCVVLMLMCAQLDGCDSDASLRGRTITTAMRRYVRVPGNAAL